MSRRDVSAGDIATQTLEYRVKYVLADFISNKIKIGETFKAMEMVQQLQSVKLITSVEADV